MGDVSFAVRAGEVLGLVGESGSGKTTVALALLGHARRGLRITAGQVLLDGTDLLALSPRDLRAARGALVSYVPQDPSAALNPALRVGTQIREVLRVHAGAAGGADGRVAEVMREVSLDPAPELLRRYPHQLSGGQQQRVALARALAIRPKIVLLDEPFASLDAHLRASVRADVQALLAETGVTGILVTHDQDEALSTADLVAVLRDGRIVQCDAPQDLYDRPADADIARFIGDANLIEGVLTTDTVDTVLGRLPVEPGCLTTPGHGGAAGPPGPARSGPATVLVRPEQIELHTDEAPAGPGTPGWPGVHDGNELSGHVVSYGYHGHDAVIHVRPVHDSAAPTIIVRTLGGPQLPPGAPVTLHARGPVLAWPDVST